MADDAALENWYAYEELRPAHDQYLTHNEKCDKFYASDQWDEQVKAELEAQGRPAITVNLAKHVVNTVLGQYITTRPDIVLKPAKDTSEESAEITTRLVKNILSNSRYPYVEGMAFADGIITDRGFLDVRLNFDKNQLGDIVITSKDPREVFLDTESSEYDPDTWTRVLTSTWWSPDDIEAIHPGKGALVLQDASQYIGEQESQAYRFGGRYGAGWAAGSGKDSEKRLRSVRVIEQQYKKVTMMTSFVDLNTGDMKPVPDSWDMERVKFVAQKYQLGIHRALGHRIRWVVSTNSVVLFDDWSPYTHYTIVPYFPYFRRGRPLGVMRDLLSPQELLNKTTSQELHVINSSANGGWSVEEGALANMTEDELESRGSETGLVLVHRRGRPRPEKIRGNEVPTGLDRVSQRASGYMTQIPGVAPLMGVMPKSDVAGVTLGKAQQASLASLQPVFDSLNLTRSLLVARIVDCIQAFYTEPRVFRTAMGDDPQSETMEMQINTDVLNDVTLGKYEIIVGTAPARDTFEETQFAEAIELRNAGVMIPDHYVIEHSHLAQKREIAKIVKTLQGFAEPTPEQEQATALQMQIKLKEVMLNLQKLEAEVGKVTSEATLNQARAQATVENAQTLAQQAQADQAMDLQKLIAQLQSRAADLQTKLTLADKHIVAKTAIERYKTMGKLISARVKAHKEGYQRAPETAAS